MNEFLNLLPHSLLHALLDTLKVLPFLFLSYLVMEMIEHHAEEKTRLAIMRAGKKAPLLASIVGAIPQCAFSAGVAGLYSGGVVTLGTLVALFLSTSDEMMPVMISHGVGYKTILIIVILKIAIAFLVGSLIDIFCKKKKEMDIGHFCHEEGCHCERGIFPSALHHSLQVSLFIFIVGAILEVTLALVGTDTLAAISEKSGFISIVLSSLVSLIPNCASSVVITELYIEGVISAGALLSGLLTGAGVGTLVLFKTNKSFRENLFVLLSLFLSGILFGGALDLFQNIYNIGL